MNVGMFVAGVFLLMLLAYDVTATTLATGAAAGPLTSKVGEAWWSIARRLSRGPQSLLVVSAGPVVIILTVGIWLFLLWGGWTLIFAADPAAVIEATTGQQADFWSRVYYAGYTTFTLGLGDYIPQGAPWKVLTSIALISGLALTTMAITYLMPVVNAVTSRRTQANSIAGLGESATDIVVRGWHDDSFDELTKSLPQFATEIISTAERHLSYPVVHYFQTSERHSDLRIQVFHLDEAVTILHHAVQADVAPAPQDLRRLRHAVETLIERVNVHPADRAPPAPDLQPLRDAGIPTVDDATFRQRVDELVEHRRRLTAFADESLWWQQGQPLDPRS